MRELQWGRDKGIVRVSTVFVGDMKGETSTFSGDMLLDLDVEFGWIGRRGGILAMGSQNSPGWCPRSLL